MGLFDFLKKKEKEPEYDVTNITIKDLNVGFMLDYDLKTWQVKEKYEYDWGQENFSHEFLLDAGDETVYLGVENRGDLFVTIMKPIKLKQIEGDVVKQIVDQKKAPSALIYEGETYHLDGDSAGYFNDITKGNNEWEELLSFEYLNADESKIVNITQWDERNVDAVAGIVIKDYHIENIIPGGK